MRKFSFLSYTLMCMDLFILTKIDQVFDLMFVMMCVLDILFLIVG